MLSIIHTADDSSLTKIKEEMAIRKTSEFFILFTMGSQTDMLIFFMLGSLGVFCIPANPKTVTAADVKKLQEVGLIGIVGSGGPYSVCTKKEAPEFDYRIFDLEIPTLGICLFFQMIARHCGAKVKHGKIREYGGLKTIVVDAQSPLFKRVPYSFTAWYNHDDQVLDSAWLSVAAKSENNLIAAGEAWNLYGVIYHPEMSNCEFGRTIFENFCFNICGAKDRFQPQDAVKAKVDALRARIGTDKGLIALSGGVDSSVSAELIHLAVGVNSRQIRAIYFTGLDRCEDLEFVRKHFGDKPWLELKVVDALDEFLAALKGKTTGLEIRQAVKDVYAKALEREIEIFGAQWIAQGTSAADLSDSGYSIVDLAENAIELTAASKEQKIATGKTEQKKHHNTDNNFSIPELIPVANLVKDGIRLLGRSIGVPEELITRHPFPGPGLAARIEGGVTAEGIRLSREVHRIWDTAIRDSGKYDEIWQAGADITLSQASYTKGERTGFGTRVVLWARTSVNVFSARPYPFEVSFLEGVARQITGEVEGVASVEYNVTPKPPKNFEPI